MARTSGPAAQAMATAGSVGPEIRTKWSPRRPRHECLPCRRSAVSHAPPTMRPNGCSRALYRAKVRGVMPVCGRPPHEGCRSRQRTRATKWAFTRRRRNATVTRRGSPRSDRRWRTGESEHPPIRRRRAVAASGSNERCRSASLRAARRGNPTCAPTTRTDQFVPHTNATFARARAIRERLRAARGNDLAQSVSRRGAGGRPDNTVRSGTVLRRPAATATPVAAIGRHRPPERAGPSHD